MQPEISPCALKLEEAHTRGRPNSVKNKNDKVWAGGGVGGVLQIENLEKGMATHFGILAWRIPWAEVPGGLQSMGS